MRRSIWAENWRSGISEDIPGRGNGKCKGPAWGGSKLGKLSPNEQRECHKRWAQLVESDPRRSCRTARGGGRGFWTAEWLTVCLKEWFSSNIHNMNCTEAAQGLESDKELLIDCLQGFFQKPSGADEAGTGIHSQLCIPLVQNAGLCGWTAGSFPHTQALLVWKQDTRWVIQLMTDHNVKEARNICVGDETNEKQWFSDAQCLQPGCLVGEIFFFLSFFYLQASF